MNRPIIGVTTYGRHERNLANQYYDEFYCVPAEYVDAVRRAGGVPILLPPGETSWERWLDITDGILLIGGSDIHPKFYNGNDQHPNLTNLDVERDESELDLARKVVADSDHPLLCVCRGMQILNVAMGGTLYEHLPEMIETDIHRSETGYWTHQPVTANVDSLVSQVMGAAEVTTISGHHQAIKKVASGLEVVATSADGVAEALQLSRHPWMVAVQWHPEKTAAVDLTQQRLFDALVQAARERKVGRI